MDNLNDSQKFLARLALALFAMAFLTAGVFADLASK